ncbi:MAG: FAD-dependent oxidoreductase, partial [Acidimicrobiales bacterium]
GATQVTIFEAGPGLLSSCEPEAGQLVADALTKRGVDVRTGVKVDRVERRRAPGLVTIYPESGDAIEADEVLVAAGREPRTDDLGLESVGLEPGTWLDVDESCRVKGPGRDWLYAAGDVNHRALLTHMGKYQARICGDAIAARARNAPIATVSWGPFNATADSRAVPQVIFTEPQVGAVGLTQAQAREQGIEVHAVEYDLGNVAGAALYADHYRGWAKMLVDPDRRVVLGATFVGPGVAELVHAATVAVVGEVPLDRLWHAVPSYPTLSEIWLRLLETYRKDQGRAS